MRGHGRGQGEGGKCLSPLTQGQWSYLSQPRASSVGSLPHSGKGAGIDGERSGLWREYFRVADALRPRLIVAENVPALAEVIGRGIVAFEDEKRRAAA